MTFTSLDFATLAREIGRSCRHRGLTVPSFRSPPRVVALNRSIRTLPGGAVVVAVRIRGRALTEVAVDMIEGTIAANRLEGTEAVRIRKALWHEVVPVNAPLSDSEHADCWPVDAPPRAL